MAESANGSNGIAAAPEENGFPALGTSVTDPDVDETGTEKTNGKPSTADAWMKAEGASTDDGAEEGGSRNENGDGNSKGPAVDISSAEAFPSLGGPAKVNSAPKWNVGGSGNAGAAAQSTPWTPAVKLSNRGQLTFELPAQNKRPQHELKKQNGEIIKEIMKRTNTTIEGVVQSSKTTFIITGSERDRIKAKREVMRELSVKSTEQITIPAAVRPHIIGKQGSKVQELQKQTFTNIKVPPTQPGQNIDEYDESTIEISIEGDAEGIAEARRLIMNIVSERGIKVNRQIECPGEYTHFIQGAFFRNIEDLERKVDKVIVPDSFVTQSSNLRPTQITVIGEKVAAEAVIAEIQKKIDSLAAEGIAHSFLTILKEKHQYFSANKFRAIHEILEQTGCTVILPAGNHNGLAVYGPPDALSQGLKAVNAKANEFTSTKLDICRPFAKAPTGAKVHARTVTRYLSKSKVLDGIQKEFNVQILIPEKEQLYSEENMCNVTIIGKDAGKVAQAKEKIIETFGAYVPGRLAYVEVEPLHHKHIPGKDGRGVRRITDKTSVEILFSEDPEDPQIALIYEGDSKDPANIPNALEEAKTLVEEAVKGLIEIKSETLMIPAEEHAKVRGENNTTLNALNPSSIIVQFGPPKARPGQAAPTAGPDAENTITLRGPPSNVETVKNNIRNFLKSGKTDEKVTVTFDYDKEYSGNLIGTKGANINKLREEYGVDINLNEGKGEIKGLQVTADAAKRKLLQQVNELKDKAVLHVKVPQKFHSVIIGAEGATVKRLEDKYHVRITFPKTGRAGDETPSEADSPTPGKTQAPDEIIVRGSKKEAEEVRQEITELYKYEQENSYAATITVKAKAMAFMFRNASKDIKQLRESCNARINIPREDKDADPETKLDITIRGQKDEVEHAKKVLTGIAKTAEDTTKRAINVDKKFHRSLIGPGGQTLKEIVTKAGGPEDRAALARMVRFPNQDANSTEITVEGKSSIVDNIIASIEKIVAEKENQVTIVVDVAPEKHRKLIGREGSVRKELEAKFNVSVDIPRQQKPGAQASPEVKVTGAPDAVEKAKAEILEMVKEPEGETVEIPRRLHHALADGGLFIRQLRDKYKVSVDHAGQQRPAKPADPKPGNAKDLPLITDDASETEEKVSWELIETSTDGEEGTFPWVLRGDPENIAKAKTEIEKALANAEKQSWVGMLTLPDPSKYRYVVGPGGSSVDKVRRETGCRITVPKNQAGEAIILHGSKEGVEKAKGMILDLVKKGGAGNGNGESRRGGRRG